MKPDPHPMREIERAGGLLRLFYYGLRLLLLAVDRWWDDLLL